MPIDSIKNITTTNYNNQNKTSQTSNSENNIEGKKYVKPLLITGLVALSSLGIYLVNRGKKGANELPPEMQKPIENVTDMLFDTFKQAGNKIEKGIAKLANGETYTGKLTRQLKNGNVVECEYDAGVLKQVTISKGGNINSSKTLNYDPVSGKLLSITSGEDKLLEKVYDSDGNLKYLYTTFKNVRNIKQRCFIEFYPNGKRKYMLSNNERTLSVYDKDGNLEYNITNPISYSFQDKDRFKAAVDLLPGQSYLNSRFIDKQGLEYRWNFSTIFNPKKNTVIANDTITKTELVNGKREYFSIYFWQNNESYLINKKDFPYCISGNKGDDIVEVGLDGYTSNIKYNVKTKQLENFTQDYSYTKEEVIENVEKLLDEARNVKKEFDKQQDYAKVYDELNTEFRKHILGRS